MSLLNDMLKDLEKRNEQPDEASSALGKDTPTLQAPTPLKPKYHFGLIAIIILALVIFTVGFYGFLLSTKINKSKLLAKQALKASIASNQTLMIVPLKSPVNIENISIADEQTTMTFQFNLSDAIHYKLDTNADRSTFILTLSNVKFSGQLPNTPLGFILSLEPKTIENDLVLTIKTMPNIQVKALQYRPQNPHQLLLILENTTPTTTTVSTPISETTINKMPVPLSRTEQANEDYQKVLSLISADQVAMSIARLKDILIKCPDFVPARRTLAVLLIKQGNLNEAKQYVEDGLKLTTDSIDLVELDARLLLSMKNPKEARQILQTLSPSIQEDPEYYALMAQTEEHLGNYATAIRLYEQLLEVDSTNATWWIGLGAALEAEGKTNSALQAYRRSLETGKLSPTLRVYVQTKIDHLT